MADVPEIARVLLGKLGPKAYAALDAMLDDPKVVGKDRLAVIKLVLDRYHPEPKVNSAVDGRRSTVMLTTSADVSGLLTRAQARIAAQPEPVELEDAKPDADD